MCRYGRGMGHDHDHDHRRDPEVRYLAEQQGVSPDEAAERIRWQSEAMQLRGHLGAALPHVSVVLLVDPQDGDRLKLHLDEPSDEDLAVVRAHLEARGILGVTDITTAPPEPGLA